MVEGAAAIAGNDQPTVCSDMLPRNKSNIEKLSISRRKGRRSLLKYLVLQRQGSYRLEDGGGNTLHLLPQKNRAPLAEGRGRAVQCRQEGDRPFRVVIPPNGFILWLFPRTPPAGCDCKAVFNLSSVRFAERVSAEH